MVRFVLNSHRKYCKIFWEYNLTNSFNHIRTRGWLHNIRVAFKVHVVAHVKKKRKEKKRKKNAGHTGQCSKFWLSVRPGQPKHEPDNLKLYSSCPADNQSSTGKSLFFIMLVCLKLTQLINCQICKSNCS